MARLFFIPDEERPRPFEAYSARFIFIGLKKLNFYLYGTQDLDCVS